MEVLACRRALVFAKELSIFEKVVEGDAKVIVKAIMADDVSYPEYGLVISDAPILAAYFCSCSFTHVKRIGNFVVDFLDRCSKSGNELEIWVKSILDDLALVARDNV